jgi:hypothetical protein
VLIFFFGICGLTIEIDFSLLLCTADLLSVVLFLFSWFLPLPQICALPVPLFDLVFLCPSFGFPADDFPPAQGAARAGFGFCLKTEISVRCIAHGSCSSLVFSHVILFFLSYTCSSLGLHFSSPISFLVVHILPLVLNSKRGPP